jgi:hypothetical protein
MTPTTVATSPPWLAIILAVLTLLAGGGGVGAYVGSRVTLRLGVKADERLARADERTADDRLIGRYETRLGAVEQRLDTVERELEDERAYSDVLSAHIRRGDPPPPPARPPRSSQ